ncbi:polysaccharide lyase 8 family protein [Glaciihabitans sp. UYNi722]|uniref:polysaccharide lyase 8 family protein n=1 Tax=Glaciihabitans sp. UYNi722 TaxID=3156344 RepID=UPI00339646D7
MNIATRTKGMTLAVIAALVAVLLSAAPADKAAAADSFDAVRDTWSQMLTGGTAYDPTTPAIAARLGGIDSDAQARWDTLDISPSRTSLWSDLASSTISSHVTSSYVRIRTMALAYATHGSTLEGNTALRTDILGALDWMQVNRFNLTNTKYDNWWDWEIGAPLALNDTMVLMYPDLTETKITLYQGAVNRFTPSVSMTGANRAWTSQVVMGAGVLQKSDPKLVNARDGMSPVFDYVTSGDGFYRDGSFIQHAVLAYTGSYGAALLKTVADVMVVLNGSPWQIVDTDQQYVYDWVFRGFDPLMVNGAVMDMVRGRELSRYYSQDHVSGQEIISAVLRLSQSAPSPTSAQLKTIVKGWVADDTSRNFLEFASIQSIVRMLAIQAAPSVPTRPPLTGSFVFPGMDRAAYRTQDWSVGFSMFSARQGAYESGNGENLKGWFTSYGQTYLYNDDLNYYGDAYWPTVDPYYLPGTTVASVARSLGSGSAYLNTRAWVGGATVAGQYSAIGQSLEDNARASDLAAKKSWFTVGGQVIALGAAITATTATEVHTTVDNRKLLSGSANAVFANGSPVGSSGTWSQPVTGVRSLMIAGAQQSTNVGYYFPNPTSMQLKQETRSGAWSQIDSRTNTPTATITRPYATASITHGTAPTNASYAYVMLPGLSAAQLAGYTAFPSMQVIANTRDLQAVRDVSRGVVAANFWAATSQQAGIITSNTRAAVVVEEKNGMLSVAVADPTQTNTGTIQVELAKSATGTLTADPRITVTQLSPTIKLTINVNGAKGANLLSSFQLTKPTWDLLSDEMGDWTQGWTRFGDSSTVTQSAGYVTVADPTTSSRSIKKIGWVAPTGAFTVEARLRMVQGSASLIARGPNYLARIILVYGTSGTVQNAQTSPTRTTTLNTTIAHTYRLVIKADHTYDLYVDGVLTWANAPSQGSGTGDLVLGTDATPTGTFDVDSVRAATGVPE